MPETSAIPTLKPTLEQQRARHAWERSKSKGCSKEYVNLAKGLPALIMNSGLMQVMAFLEQKGKRDDRAQLAQDPISLAGSPPTLRKRDDRAQLAQDLRDWLIQCEKLPGNCSEFEEFMDALLKAEPRQFQEITTEAMAWLRWMRQMAAARHVKNGGHSDDKS